MSEVRTVSCVCPCNLRSHVESQLTEQMADWLQNIAELCAHLLEDVYGELFSVR